MSLDYHLKALRKLLSVRKINTGYFNRLKKDFNPNISILLLLYILIFYLNGYLNCFW
ncbi:conserved hypothetical protein [Xenorhabdus nematophila F1]|nr:conserved hypothetical protein [Xenorhabdus nematophila F1]